MKYPSPPFTCNPCVSIRAPTYYDQYKMFGHPSEFFLPNQASIRGKRERERTQKLAVQDQRQNSDTRGHFLTLPSQGTFSHLRVSHRHFKLTLHNIYFKYTRSIVLDAFTHEQETGCYFKRFNGKLQHPTEELILGMNSSFN